jgi:putative endonuclease
MRAAGALFEARACEALQRAGLTLLARNFHTRHGELDLVMRHGDTVVFVEVRHRVRATHGDAASSVTATKQARLISAAQLWLSQHPQHAHRPCRFDVVCYDGSAEQARMSWWRDAFQAS